MEGHTMEYFIMGNPERLSKGGSTWPGLEGWGRVSRQTTGSREWQTENQQGKIPEWKTTPCLGGPGGR